MRIVCFGDSNTWGYNWRDGYRLPKRYTALMAQHHPEWHIVEEGLNGRTMVSNDPRIASSGEKMIDVILRRHYPIDLLVIALGANDCRRNNARTIQEWHGRLVRFLDAVDAANKKFGPVPILLVTPPMLNLKALDYGDVRTIIGESGANVLKDAQLDMAAEAEKRGYDCLMCASFGLTGSDRDGIHLETPMHARLAEHLEEKIEQIERKQSRA